MEDSRTAGSGRRKGAERRALPFFGRAENAFNVPRLIAGRVPRCVQPPTLADVKRGQASARPAVCLVSRCHRVFQSGPRGIPAFVLASDADPALMRRSVPWTMLLGMNVEKRRKIANTAFQVVGLYIDH